MDYMAKITSALSLLSTEVEARASINLQDINVHAENFYKDLLNIIYDLNLVNLNSINQNATSIDLADPSKSLAIQVTCTSERIKIEKTVEKFIEKKYYNTYKNLNILILTKKKNYQIKTLGDSNFTLTIKKDIKDYKDIIRDIQNSSINKQKEIVEFLEKNINYREMEKTPKEVKTLLMMIEFLSDDDHPEAGNGFTKKPDPENKIYKRFSDYSTELTDKYVRLAPIYSSVYNCIKEQSDIGMIKTSKMEAFLEEQSDDFLIKAHNNPMIAFNNLRDFYCKKISLLNVEYDKSAIEFFLIENLISCIVFPNKEVS